MLTKREVDAVLLGTVVTVMGTLPLQAAPLQDTRSPYRLSIEAVKHTKSNDSAAGATSKPPIASQNPQLYHLDYRYRSQPKSTKIKAELPAAILKTQVPVQKSFSNGQSSALAELPFAKEILLAAQAASLDPSLVHAVIHVESRYRARAISPKGAVGLMQVLPDTAARYGLREAIYVPKGNIKAGTLYLRDLMMMFDNRLELALAAYNAGEGAVKKYAGQIPPYPETRHYVKAVMAQYALNGGAHPWFEGNSTLPPAPVEARAVDAVLHDAGALETGIADTAPRDAGHIEASVIEAAGYIPLALQPVASRYAAENGLMVSADRFMLNAVDAID